MISKCDSSLICLQVNNGDQDTSNDVLIPFLKVDSSNNKDVTFSELFRRAFNFGHGLRERGFRQGDVYMSLLPNTIEFLVAMLGVIAAGGVFSSLNPANKKGISGVVKR